MHGDKGDIVLGWLTKLTVTLAVLGVLGFEAASIAVTRVGTKDAATNAAFEASQDWLDRRDLDHAYSVAEAYALEHGGTIAPEDFEVAEDGTVTLTMRREAASVLLHRFAAGRDWTDIRETGSGKATPSR